LNKPLRSVFIFKTNVFSVAIKCNHHILAGAINFTVHSTGLLCTYVCKKPHRKYSQVLYSTKAHLKPGVHHWKSVAQLVQMEPKFHTQKSPWWTGKHAGAKIAFLFFQNRRHLFCEDSSLFSRQKGLFDFFVLKTHMLFSFNNVNSLRKCSFHFFFLWIPSSNTRQDFWL